MTEERDDLAGASRALRELADALLLRRRSPKVTFVRIDLPSVEPAALLDQVRASPLGDLVLPAGAPLSIEAGGDYWPDLGLRADDALLREVSATAFGWNWDTTGYPDAASWSRELDLSFWYGDAASGGAIKQVFRASASGNDQDAGDAHVSRDVWAQAYAETGYEGHNQMYRAASAHEIRFFTDLVRTLVAKEWTP